MAATWLLSDQSKRPRSNDTDRYNLVSTGVRLTGGGEIAALDPRSFAARPIGRITQATVQRWVDSVKTTHSPSTVRRMFSTVRAVFSFAEKDKVIPYGKSPCRNIRLPEVPLVARPVLIGDDEDREELPAGQWTLSNEDLNRLADKLGDYALMMWIGVALGFRWSEVAGLTVESLNLLRGEISVTQALDRNHKLAPPKTVAGKRTLVDHDLVADFAAHMQRRGLTAANPKALLFVNGQGRPLSHSPWRRTVWLPAVQAAGLTGLRFHDLRSVNSSILIAEGVDAKTLQARFGHSQIATTLGLYARATPRKDREASEKVHAVLRRSRPGDDTRLTNR
jgi:integrase